MGSSSLWHVLALRPEVYALALRRMLAAFAQENGGQCQRQLQVLILALAGIQLCSRAFRRLLNWRAQSALLKGLRHIPDPTFGAKFGVVHNTREPDRLWEAFLDTLCLERTSPLRRHMRQLLGRREIDDQLRELFELAAGGAERISRQDFSRLSRGISGHVHMLLKTQERVPLALPTPEDQQWIFRRFDHYFPPERPLGRDLFPGYFKLILVRRIIRTLIAYLGLRRLRSGASQPLVVDIQVDPGQGHPPFRLHTVLPNATSAPAGERLGLIEEVGDETEA